jgi:hypothetical protein
MSREKERIILESKTMNEKLSVRKLLSSMRERSIKLTILNEMKLTIILN